MTHSTVRFAAAMFAFVAATTATVLAASPDIRNEDDVDHQVFMDCGNVQPQPKIQKHSLESLTTYSDHCTIRLGDNKFNLKDNMHCVIKNSVLSCK
ncbi:MAG TPA: hypothetical protein PLF40_19940 [Kofleriaceae bacterium]|nr:hypothetical protein [Kofleriaceae bacterium]